MKNSKEEILRRIKTGLQNSTLQNLDEVPENGKNTEITERKTAKLYKENQEKKQTLINRFIEEFTRMKGTVKAVLSEDEIKEFIIELIEDRAADHLAIWETGFLKRINLKEFLWDRGIRFASPLNKEEMARAGIGITEADFAIADTGTMVLLSDKNRPRTVSLVPPIHIAIIRSDVIVENIFDLFQSLETRFPQPGGVSEVTSCMTFITGPSRTADIELNLTLGVHGPKEVFALIYP